MKSTSPFSAVWVVVPVYNEGAVIGEVIDGLKTQFANIVCIDDASSDFSSEIALNRGAVVLRHIVNLGQGAALQTGITFALQNGAEYIITFDADGQHRVSDAVHLAHVLRDRDVDVVLGSRFLETGTNFGMIKRLVLRAAVVFERLLTGVKLTDAHNGLRGFNRRAAMELKISQNRMAHASEITSIIGRSRLKYMEIPVTINYTDYSKAKGQSVWNLVNILRELFIK